MDIATAEKLGRLLDSRAVCLGGVDISLTHVIEYLHKAEAAHREIDQLGAPHLLRMRQVANINLKHAEWLAAAVVHRLAELLHVHAEIQSYALVDHGNADMSLFEAAKADAALMKKGIRYVQERIGVIGVIS